MKINVIEGTANAFKYAAVLAGLGHSVNLLKPDDQYTSGDAVVIASPLELRERQFMTYVGVCPVLCESPVTWCPPTRGKHPHMLAAHWLFTPIVRRLRSTTHWVTQAHLWFDYYHGNLQELREMVTALYLFGPLRDSKVFRRQVGGQEVTVALCHHRSGVLSTINCGRHSMTYERGIRMTYDTGKVEQIVWSLPEVDDDACREMISHWLRVINDEVTEWPTLALGYEAYVAIHGEETS